jgi:hypothetical protein
MITIEPEDGKKIADNVALCVDCEKKLVDAYPGYFWMVKFDEDGGMAYIINATIQSSLHSNMMYAYSLKLSRVLSDPNLKCVVMAGGEILERAGQPRGWWKGDMPETVEGVKDKHQPLIRRDVKLI